MKGNCMRLSFALVVIFTVLSFSKLAECSATFVPRACEERTHCAECLHDTSCLFCRSPESKFAGSCMPRTITATAECLVLHTNKASDNTAKIYEMSCPPRPLERTFNVTLMVLLALTMLGMGATVSWADLGYVFGASISVLTGLVAQYLVFPLTCLLLATMFGLSDTAAVGLLLLSITAGGAMSQLWTYFTEGDVALSIVLTFSSNILSFVTLPLLGYSLTRPFADGAIKIDFGIVGLTSLAFLIPVAIGVTIKTFRPRAAIYVEKFGVVVGIITILAAIVFGSVVNPHLYRSNWQIWLIGIGLPFLGVPQGYLLARLTKRSPKHKRTIGWETGVKNSAMTIALISSAFDQPHASEALAVPLIYSIFVFIDGVILVALYHGWYKKRWPDFEEPDKATDDNDDKPVALVELDVEGSSELSDDETFCDDKNRPEDVKKVSPEENQEGVEHARPSQAASESSTGSIEHDYSEGEQSTMSR